MARIEDATIKPKKIELIRDWLPGRSWFTGNHSDVEIVGSYRFDDPEGEVGVEIMLVRSPGDAATWQVPLSYRGEPLDGGEEFFITTMEHSVLGPRWIYDAIGDPVFRTELARVIAQADSNVAEIFESPEGPVEIPRKTEVTGSGTSEPGVPEFFAAEITDATTADGAALIETGLARLVLTRRVSGAALDSALAAGPAGQLTGTWPGQDKPVPLAALALGPAN